MGRVAPLLAVLVLLTAGCTSFAGEKTIEESFELGGKGTVQSVHSIQFKVRLKGDLLVNATSSPTPVLVVLQAAENCGSFADQGYIPSSRYEDTHIEFSYYVAEPGEYCLSFSNRNPNKVQVEAHIDLPS